MVWKISAEIEVVLIGGPGIIDFMDPAVYIPNFPYMVISIVRGDGYYPISDGIIPVPVFGIHNPIIMVHPVCPGNMDPVRYTVMIINLTVPDRIIVITFDMIGSNSMPAGSCIMFTIFGMGPGSLLPGTCITTD